MGQVPACRNQKGRERGGVARGHRLPADLPAYTEKEGRRGRHGRGRWPLAGSPATRKRGRRRSKRKEGEEEYLGRGGAVASTVIVVAAARRERERREGGGGRAHG